MHERKEQNPNDSPSESQKTSRKKAVYSIIQYDDKKKSYWLRLGTAFVNRDQSLTVYLDALPTNHQLHIRDVPSSKEKK